MLDYLKQSVYTLFNKTQSMVRDHPSSSSRSHPVQHELKRPNLISTPKSVIPSRKSLIDSPSKAETPRTNGSLVSSTRRKPGRKSNKEKKSEALTRLSRNSPLATAYGIPTTHHKDDDRKKKFYIVHNGNKPTEMYRTDLLHRLKHEESDDHELVKLTDRWRDEWFKGIQVPVGESLPEYVFKEEDCRNRPPRQTSAYIRPKRYIATMDRKYLAQKKHVMSIPSHLYRYLVDDLDECWLAIINKIRKHEKLQQIDMEWFLSVMDSLEVDTFKRIHTEILESLSAHYVSGEVDNDAMCDICLSPDEEPGDPIVFCDGCNIACHMSCYGILPPLPEGEWLCQVCSRSLTRSPSCVLCPNRFGAMKMTKPENHWAHVACALWMPDVRFQNYELREPISNICDIPVEFLMKKCSVCDTNQGATIRCSLPNCEAHFHVSCAQRAFLRMAIENDESTKTGVRLDAFCKGHSREKYAALNNDQKPLDQIREVSQLEEEFFMDVDCDELSERLNMPTSVVNDVYCYWKIKRNLNHNKPLLQEPIDIKIVPYPNKELKRLDKTFADPTQLMLMRSGEKSSYDKVIMLRKDLEKLRNLSYLIQRREKTKKMHHEIENEIFDLEMENKKNELVVKEHVSPKKNEHHFKEPNSATLPKKRPRSDTITNFQKLPMAKKMHHEIQQQFANNRKRKDGYKRLKIDHGLLTPEDSDAQSSRSESTSSEEAQENVFQPRLFKSLQPIIYLHPVKSPSPVEVKKKKIRRRHSEILPASKKISKPKFISPTLRKHR